MTPPPADRSTPPRDVMTYDVVTVGAGPAGLAFAIRLKQLDPKRSVCVIEKGAQIGAHSLSGAVIETACLDALLPTWRANPPNICIPVQQEKMLYLTPSRAYRLPLLKKQRGDEAVVSLGGLCGWLEPQAQALGVDLFSGFAAAELLFHPNGHVMGVRLGDMGIQQDGQRSSQYSPGVEIHAAITVLAEGARGHLTKQAIERFSLGQGRSPQTYSIGMKELWQLPSKHGRAGAVLHTIGWPADRKTFAGGFLYHLDHDMLALGYVNPLGYRDPNFSPWESFQHWKQHPAIRPLLAEGRIIGSGARAVVTGGWQALPCCEMPGAILIGDTAGLLNVAKIKGTHQAIRSGMIAAAHLVQTELKSNGFDHALRASPVGRELYRVRNVKPGLAKGLWFGLFNTAWELLSRGHSPWTLAQTQHDFELDHRSQTPLARTGPQQLTLPPRNRQEAVYLASTHYAPDQPIHLKVSDPSICSTHCYQTYGNPCQHFCPVNVYEMINDPTAPHGRRLQINASNCIHCKTCDIKDPYQIITWTPSEGGSGPNYAVM